MQVGGARKIEFDSTPANGNNKSTMQQSDCDVVTWTCPCCGRTRDRCGTADDPEPRLVAHRDRMRRYVMRRLKDLYGEWSTLFDRRPKTVELYQDAREIGDFVQRFCPVLLCADCTSAESEVRRKIDADSYFTLRPDELRDALIVKAGMPHSLSGDRVQELAELYEHTWHRVVLARKQLVEVALGAVISGSDDWRPALGEGREAVHDGGTPNSSGDSPAADPRADATESAARPWSDTGDQELATRYAAGSEIREIAQEINRSPLAVWRRLVHLGLMQESGGPED